MLKLLMAFLCCGMCVHLYNIKKQKRKVSDSDMSVNGWLV